ncbi:MAG: AbiTii domain-containing protein [Clostridium sp.]
MQKKNRSKIIKELIMDNINVSQAMQSLDLMLEDIDEKEIKKWVNSEINGYKNGDALPNYRRATTTLEGDLQVGYCIYKNVNIPISDLKSLEFFTKFDIIEPVSTIIQISKAEQETESHSLVLEVNPLLVNKYKAIKGYVIRAHRKLSIYTYNNILEMIKSKLIEIFKVLERNYGNLDSLYIDFSDSSKKDIVIKEISLIVYNDNSVEMGNNNYIENSIVGNKNEN